jgi:nucleoside diphosphate kinase
MATIINLFDLINEANDTESKKAAKKELRKEYAAQAAKLHPDHGGSQEEMAKLNEEYATKEALLDLDADLREHVEAILHLPGINIEVCGTWVWVSGDTKPVKDQIKAAGFRFAKKKIMWYYRNEENAHYYRGKGASMEHIREKYGSEEVKSGGPRGLLH